MAKRRIHIAKSLSSILSAPTIERSPTAIGRRFDTCNAHKDHLLISWFFVFLKPKNLTGCLNLRNKNIF